MMKEIMTGKMILLCSTYVRLRIVYFKYAWLRFLHSQLVAANNRR